MIGVVLSLAAGYLAMLEADAGNSPGERRPQLRPTAFRRIWRRAGAAEFVRASSCRNSWATTASRGTGSVMEPLRFRMATATTRPCGGSLVTRSSRMEQIKNLTPQRAGAERYVGSRVRTSAAASYRLRRLRGGGRRHQEGAGDSRGIPTAHARWNGAMRDDQADAGRDDRRATCSGTRRRAGYRSGAGSFIAALTRARTTRT